LDAITDPQGVTIDREFTLGPHFGLTPRKYASREIDRNGSITKAAMGPCAKCSCRLR
jgi:transposase